MRLFMCVDLLSTTHILSTPHDVMQKVGLRIIVLFARFISCSPVNNLTRYLAGNVRPITRVTVSGRTRTTTIQISTTSHGHSSAHSV